MMASAGSTEPTVDPLYLREAEEYERHGMSYEMALRRAVYITKPVRALSLEPVVIPAHAGRRFTFEWIVAGSAGGRANAVRASSAATSRWR
jgi:hypothetical protein